MVSAIFFNGRRINVPGAYSVIDPSGLASVTPSSTGIVALVGEAEGGKPLTVEPEHSDHTRASTALSRYKSGPLRTMSQFAFDPAPTDPNIPGGAQRLVNVKVNPATQSTGHLKDVGSANSIDLTSVDWGLYTAQINVSVAAGTNVGKKVTVVFEDTTEVMDDIGGVNLLTVQYTGGGWTAVTLEKDDTAVYGRATRTPDAGLLGSQVANDLNATTVLSLVSSNAGDTTQTVRLLGVSGTNTLVDETVTLNGTTPVLTTAQFAHFLGCYMSAAAVGSVAITGGTGPLTIATLTPGQQAKGEVAMAFGMGVQAGTGTLTPSTAGAGWVLVEGLSSTGAPVQQLINCTPGTAVALSNDFIALQVMWVGNISTGRTVALAGSTFRAPLATYKTLQRVVDFAVSNGLHTASSLSTSPATQPSSDLDPTNLAGPSINGVDGSLQGTLAAIVDRINSNSQLVTAAKSAGATLPPTTTAAPVYLSGGSEGTTTITQWQQAFALLAKRRVNIIVPLTEDPAVHALLLTHLNDRAGRLRSEANGYVGIAASGVGETRANIKTKIRSLASRNISALSQECKRIDPDTGESAWWPPYALAVMAAGMQAGGAVGEPLTHKVPGVSDIRNSATWDTQNDAEEMIDAGLMFAENRDGEGIRFVRSVTTYLADDNLGFCEMSANASANTAVFEFRRRLEQKVGQRGLAGSAAAIKGLAHAVLSELVDDQIIVAFRALQIEQVGDVFPVSVEMAPVLPINFIPTTVHLVTVSQAA